MYYHAIFFLGGQCSIMLHTMICSRKARIYRCKRGIMVLKDHNDSAQDEPGSNRSFPGFPAVSLPTVLGNR